MLWQGWANDTGDTALSWPDLVFWVFPVLDPPGSAAAIDATVVLWYIRAYMWFVLLTPLMLAAYRRWPVRAMLAPLVVVAVDQVLGWGLESADNFGPVLIDFCTFATCWMLGFAHREGKLRAIKPIVLVALTAAAFAVGGGWTYLHPSPDTGYDLGEIPLGQALISAGAVLILVRPHSRAVAATRRDQRAGDHDLPHAQHRHHRGRSDRHGDPGEQHVRVRRHGGCARRPRGAGVRLGRGRGRAQACEADPGREARACDGRVARRTAQPRGPDAADRADTPPDAGPGACATAYPRARGPPTARPSPRPTAD
jgi:hypothetical protein